LFSVFGAEHVLSYNSVFGLGAAQLRRCLVINSLISSFFSQNTPLGNVFVLLLHRLDDFELFAAML
jgi:hypothetical protein